MTTTTPISMPKKEPSKFNSQKRFLNKIVNPMRQTVKDEKTKSTEDIISFLNDPDTNGHKRFLCTQEALALLHKTPEKGLSLFAISPVYLVEIHVLANAYAVTLHNRQQTLNQEGHDNLKNLKGVPLSMNQIDKAVKAFKKNMSKHFECTSVDITKYCTELKDNLLEENRILHNISDKKSIIKSNTTEVV